MSEADTIRRALDRNLTSADWLTATAALDALAARCDVLENERDEFEHRLDDEIAAHRMAEDRCDALEQAHKKLPLVVAWISRARGLAESIEHPPAGMDLPPGMRAVAFEIAFLLEATRTELLTSAVPPAGERQET